MSFHVGGKSALILRPKLIFIKFPIHGIGNKIAGVHDDSKIFSSFKIS